MTCPGGTDGGTSPEITAGSGQRPILSLEGVTKTYRSADAVIEVLRGVNLTLTEGQKVSLIGPSGSGKSTLLALIAGLIRPDTGRINIDGVAIESLDDTDRAALRANRVGVVLQSENLIPFLSAVENVELAMGFRTGHGAQRRARTLLERLEVDHRRDHLPRELSGGEAQRVSIAVALANEPSLLLADEVVGALDSSTAARVLDFIFSADIAVLFVTHSRVVAERADSQLRLEDRVLVPQ